MRIRSSSCALLVLCTGCSWSRTPEDAIASLTGQKLILPKGGDQAKVKLNKSQLGRLKGTCDVAVVVTDTDWKKGTAQFKLHNIGTAAVINQKRGICRNWQNEIVLELFGFAHDEPGDSLLRAAHQVLETPEEFLESRGIHFAIPPGAEDQTPVKPPPPIIYPKTLLRVDGAYTDAARSVKRKGSIQVSLVVGTDGRIHKARLIRGLGFGLDENAIRVLSLWRFEPALQMDQPVAVASSIQMSFDIM